MPLTELTIQDALAARLIRLAFAISDKKCPLPPECKCELCSEFDSVACDYLAVIEEEEKNHDHSI